MAPCYIFILLLIGGQCVLSQQINNNNRNNGSLVDLFIREFVGLLLTNRTLSQNGTGNALIITDNIMSFLGSNRGLTTNIVFNSLRGQLGVCGNDVLQMMTSLGSMQPWALKMIDACGKPMKDIMQGNLIWFGSYDTCRQIEHSPQSGRAIKGAYVEISIALPKAITAALPPSPTGAQILLFVESTLVEHVDPSRSKFTVLEGDAKVPPTLRWDLCIPNTCTRDNIMGVFNPLFNATNSGLAIASVDFVESRSIKGDIAAYISIIILALFVLMCVIGTTLDIDHNRSNTKNEVLENSTSANKTQIKNGGIGLTIIQVTDDKVPLDKNEVVEVGDESEKNGINNPGMAHIATIDVPYGNGIKNGHSYKMEDLKPITKDVTATKQSLCGRLVMAFSVRQNGKKILDCSSPSGSLGCLHGIRVMSMAWVILGHTVIMFPSSVENKVFLFSLIKTYWFQVIMNGTLSVDTFFFLSGLLVSYIFLREVSKSGKITLKQMGLFYFHRYWRLTPLYMIVIMIYTNLSNYLIDGPMGGIFQGEASERHCREGWWTNILYINNFVKCGQAEMCMSWSWYLANDMQFYVISPLALIPLALGFRIIGLLVLFGMFACQIIYTGYIDWDIGNPGVANANSGVFFEKVYIKPYARVGVYAVGLLLGYLLHKRKNIKIPKVVLVIVSALAITAGLLATYLTFDQYQDGHKWSSDGLVAFNTLFRPIWALALFWLVFVCVNGYGGFINDILSWSAWIPLSRLTYAAYLIHLIVISVNVGNMRGPAYLNGNFIVNTFIGTFAVTYAISFLLSVIIEAPFLGLEKVMLKRKR